MVRVTRAAAAEVGGGTWATPELPCPLLCSVPHTIHAFILSAHTCLPALRTAEPVEEVVAAARVEAPWSCAAVLVPFDVCLTRLATAWASRERDINKKTR